jgi:flagellar basal-body rod modification protein FlgD
MQVNTTQSIQTTAETSVEQDTGGRDFFLKLLVAQMEHQDPLKPQDATEMSSQLAQYDMVEQQLNTNDLLEAMLANSQSGNSDMTTASSYLGHQVSANTSSFTFDGSSPVQISADLESDAAIANVQIVDSSGQTIRTLHNSFLPSGINNLSWDGKTDGGVVARPDNYTMKVAATDSSDFSIPAKTSITGQVTSVRLTPEGVNIMVGETPVSIASIKEIK